MSVSWSVASTLDLGGIPRLTILEPGPQGDLSALAADPAVYIWRDLGGQPCAYGHTVGGLHWMHWPRLASFRFDATGSDVVAVPAAPGRDDQILDTFHRMVLPLALQIRGREALHASAVVINGGVVGFCATSGTGKSTLAYALDQFAGCTLWSDDVIVFDVTAASIAALPLPFDTRLWPDAASSFPRARNARPSRRPAVRPVAALCQLTRLDAPDGDVRVRRLAPARAVPVLLEHAHCFDLLDPARKKRMMSHYLEVAARVPVYALDLPAGLDRLSTLAPRVAAALSRAD